MENLMAYVPWLGILAMVFAVVNFIIVKKYPVGSEKMNTVAEKIHSGAMVFLRKEYSIIAIFMAIVFVTLGLVIKSPTGEAVGWWTGLAYVCGGLCSMGAGLFGMEAATRSSVRSCNAAKESGTPQALMVAFLGGSVMGISVAALGVIGLGVAYLLNKDNPTVAPIIINGFAMGASSIALFARVGGGIYTKSADVGSDLVGKIEAGIPEDDPRNPGVIADNVGDCVGDTAGMGADLFESYVGSVVAAIAIGATMSTVAVEQLKLMSYPIFLIAIGLVASLIGIYSIHILKKIDPQSALRYCTFISGGFFLIGAAFLTQNMMGKLDFFWATLAGMVCGILIGVESEYFTSGPPVKEVARASQSGAATTMISGLAVGFKSTILPVVTLCIAIFLSFKFGHLYGIALAGIGMLATVGVVMATDSYGPIADNAGGIAEMSGLGPEIRKITDKLDALGNTTAAIGKGFAIGSAALTALALFSAFQQTIKALAPELGFSGIDITKPEVTIGLFLGGVMPFAIAALTMEAVGRAANVLVMEIRRQFKEIVGIMEGKAEPEVEKCIAIVTEGSLKEMIIPGSLAVICPIAMGLLFGPEALGGFLAGATTTGLLLGVFMANSGATWDNAKKWIEEGNLGGKGTETHKAAIVGDTVGDPFKDTSGPSMNILIKLMSIVSLVFAPVLAKFTPLLLRFFGK
jgi:K(+)-stimulated pyrophosphate-energized sodium pump